MSTIARHALPIDVDWVRWMVGPAGRCQRDALERSLIEYGWGAYSEVSALPWCESQCAPFYFGIDASSGSPDCTPWRMDFGCLPGVDHDGMQSIQLGCALRWPAFGEDPDDPAGLPVAMHNLGVLAYLRGAREDAIRWFRMGDAADRQPNGHLDRARRMLAWL
ncbi:hypothetical protein [Nocardia sp. CA-119907]|uniref:hypothetical protein n=1 Tax=Nocardia sp. CA-119907 TaxID=3239973 RepID=UPI003D973841